MFEGGTSVQICLIIESLGQSLEYNLYTYIYIYIFSKGALELSELSQALHLVFLPLGEMFVVGKRLPLW